MNDDKTWYLYLIRCADGSLYTGITTDVSRRLSEHAQGRGARRLRGRGPLALVFSQAVGDHSRALSIEHQVKRLRRAQKERLVSGQLQLAQMVPQERR